MRNSLYDFIIIIATVLIFGAIGIFGTFFPKEMQRYVINYYDKNNKLKSINPYLGFIKTNGYLCMLRISGIVSLIAFIFILSLLVIKIIYNM